MSMRLCGSTLVNQSRFIYLIGPNEVVGNKADEGCSLLDHDTHLWVSDQQPAGEKKEIDLRT